MPAITLINEFKELLVSFVRHIELEAARGNESRLEAIRATSGDELLRSWLWKFTIIGGLVCFLVLPIALAILGSIISMLIMAVLWVLLKAAMGIVLIALVFAIYITVNKSAGKD